MIRYRTRVTPRWGTAIVGDRMRGRACPPASTTVQVALAVSALIAVIFAPFAHAGERWEAIQSLPRVSVEVTLSPNHPELLIEDMRRRVPDLAKVRALVGYEPQVHLDEILDRVSAYFTDGADRA